MQMRYSDRAGKMRPSVVREILKMMADPEMISFGGGNPAEESFPAEQIREISDRLMREQPAQMLQYSITEGSKELRQAGREFLNRRWQVIRPEDQVLVTSGSQQVMDFLGKLLCNEGDLVATENPAFMGALNAFRSYGAELAGVEMQPDGVNLEALERVLSGRKKPKLFYTIPNFQNPTGITTSLEKRKAVYQLCLQYQVPILEDNPYGELRISGEPIPPIKLFDTEGIVVYAASLSKILSPGMRLALCAGPADLMAKMTLAKQVNDVHTNIWAQRVCAEFLTHYDMQAHLERVSGIYRRKADLMMDEFDRLLAGRVEYTLPEGGMFVWVTLPQGADMPGFVKACLERKLMVVPGNAFMVDENAPCQSVRTNFATPTEQQIRHGVAIMAEVLGTMGL